MAASSAKDLVNGRRAAGRPWVVAASAAHALETVVALVLALRLWMAPEQLGLAMLAVSLFPLLDALADLGLGAAVAEAGHDARKLSTLFWLRLGVAVVLFGALGVFSGLLAGLHGAPVVATLLSVYGVKLLLDTAAAIPEAQLVAEERLEALALVRLVADALAFGTFLAVASAGQPVLAFVAGPIARALVRAVALQVLRPFRPRLELDGPGLAALLGASVSRSLGGFFQAFHDSIDVQIVGLLAGSTAVGIYGAARALVAAPLGFVTDLTAELALPLLARLRGDVSALRAAFLAASGRALALLLPLVGFLVAAGPDALEVLGPRYAIAAPALRLLALVALVRALAQVVPSFLDDAQGPRPVQRARLLLALALPAALVVLARRLGADVAGTSFALAAAVVFPLAFFALLAPALPRLGVRGRAYLRLAVSPMATTFAAAAVASAARAMAHAAGVELGPRLLVAAVALVVILFIGRVPASWAHRGAALRVEA